MSASYRYPRPPQLATLGDRHAVVEASAGTGKTYLLEHLVVELLLGRGVELEQILVVTFTEKAAAELADRIRRKLDELAALAADHPGAAAVPAEACWAIDDAARRRLRQALFAFDRAGISTIHAFCQRLLAEHAFLNRRLFEEETIDEEQAFEAAFAETLRRDVATDATLGGRLEAWLSAGGDLGKVKRALLASQRKLACLYPPRPEALRPALAEADILAAAGAVLALSPGALGAALRAEKVNASTVKAVEGRLTELHATLAAPAAARDIARIALAIEEIDGKEKRLFGYLAGCRAKNPGSAALPSLLRPLAVLEENASLLGLLVAGILPPLAGRLEARKRQAGLYDFQDMLTLVARSLDGEGEVPRTLLASLRARYRHALIDEFQDTDEVQWRIFRRIFFESDAGHCLTVIGDPKQAIYAFRGADVHTYLAARAEVKAAGGAHLPLAENFRSSAPLIAAYNAILDDAGPFFRPDGGIHYDHPVSCGRPGLALTDAAGAPAPGVVVLELETQLPNLLTYQVKKALLGRMAEEIRGLLDPGGGLRFGPAGAGARVRAGDIFVLTRTTRESREVGDVLRAARLPFAYFKQERLFDTIEARELLDLLRAIADPDDPTARARAFITPFFGLGLVDLAACDELDAGSALLRTLYEWRAFAEAGDFEALFARIVEDSGVVSRELFFRDSERSLTNYLHLLEILQEEATRTRATIRELVQTLGAYIAGTRRPPGEARDIQRLETDADAVQIMTIHHAKGLEAAVVFLYGGLWSPPFNDVHAFHEGAARVVRVGRQPPAEDALYQVEQDDEERRVLYVALTRAKGRLYLPRFPKAFNQLRGCYQHINRRLGELFDGFTPPEVKALFDRRAVPTPVAAAPALAEAPAATLARWQPPAALLAPDPPADARVAEAAARAGFVITSYSAVKDRHGSFVAAVAVSDDPVAGDGESPGATARPLPDEELPRGRLTGRYLHEVIEELPWDSLAGDPPLAQWIQDRRVAELFEHKRRRHDRSPAHVPHAQRLVHTALTTPLVLGGAAIPGLAAVDRVLREMEFLYPIPERAHPLLARAAGDADTGALPFRIERGLVKGYIDLVFEHHGRTYVCDWKGDWLPRWQAAAVAEHCERNYHIQAQLYAMATLRLLEVSDPDSYEQRFGGVLYCFLRGMDRAQPDAGVYFHRPAWDEVLAWQEELVSPAFWRLG